VASPKGYEPDKSVLAKAKLTASQKNSRIGLFNKPQEALRDADIIYTDVWTSMGQEKEGARRKKAFRYFQVNAKLVRLARKGALIMHCLPAHRGEEITDEVIDSRDSVVFDQAENRLHVQKAILITLLK
jgi:ornithine carbamoyltransferase